MMMYEGGILQVLLESFLKGPRGFSYVFIITCVKESIFIRNIKESIFIRVNDPTLNKNIDKFNLPHIWDRVLLNSAGVTLKRHVQVVGNANSNQPNIPTHLNQPNIPTHLGQPSSPMQFFTGSEYAHRTS